MKNQHTSSAKQIDLDKESTEQLKQIVLARMMVMPDTVRLSIGSNNLNKDEALDHIHKEDEIGKQLMSIELDFLRDLASGAIYGNE